MHTPLVAVRVDKKKVIIIICFLKDEYSYVVIILLVLPVIQQQNKQSFWLSHTTISGERYTSLKKNAQLYLRSSSLCMVCGPSQQRIWFQDCIQQCMCMWARHKLFK